MRLTEQFIGATFVVFMLAFIIPSAVVLPNVTPPLADITSALGISQASNGLPYTVTNTNPNATNISPNPVKNNNAVCGVGVVGGAAAGAFLGTFVFPGVGTALGAVAGAIGGGLAGCLVGPSLSPSSTQYWGSKINNAGSTILNTTGLGTIATAIVLVVSAVGGLVKFLPDFLVYMAAVMAYPGVDDITKSAIGVFLSYYVLLLSLFIVRTVRGVGE